MTLEGMFEAIGGDYKSTLHRFADNEGLLRKFVKKFTQDPTYQDLEQAIEAEDRDRMFIAAHTLKGLTGNLGFDNFFLACELLVTVLRGNEQSETIMQRFEAVKTAYVSVIETIQKLDE